MSQEEVYNWLKKKRDSGDHKYYTVSEIHEHINIKEISRVAIQKNVAKLGYRGFIDILFDIVSNTKYVRLRIKNKGTVNT